VRIERWHLGRHELVEHGAVRDERRLERDGRERWHERGRRDSLAPFTRDRRMKGLIVEEGQPLLL